MVSEIFTIKPINITAIQFYPALAYQLSHFWLNLQDEKKHYHHQRIHSILCERLSINYLPQSRICITEPYCSHQRTHSIRRCCLTYCWTSCHSRFISAQMMSKGNMKSKNKHQYELDRLYHHVKASGGRDHCHNLHKMYNGELKAYKKIKALNHLVISNALGPCTDQ